MSNQQPNHLKLLEAAKAAIHWSIIRNIAAGSNLKTVVDMAKEMPEVSNYLNSREYRPVAENVINRHIREVINLQVMKLTGEMPS